MKRWLLNLAAALSLTLLVATAALWVRSRFVIDSYLTWNADGTERVLTSARGQVVLRKIWLKYPSAPTAEFRSARLTEGYTTRTGFAQASSSKTGKPPRPFPTRLTAGSSSRFPTGRSPSPARRCRRSCCAGGSARADSVRAHARRAATISAPRPGDVPNAGRPRT